MNEQKHLITFELATVYTIIMTALLLALLNPDDSQPAYKADNTAGNESAIEDKGIPQNLEPNDVCLCDHGFKLAQGLRQMSNCFCEGQGRAWGCPCDYCNPILESIK